MASGYMLKTQLLEQGMRRTVETSDFAKWLINKSKCPKCNAKDSFIASGHCFVTLLAYLKCYKCSHMWDEVPLEENQ